MFSWEHIHNIRIYSDRSNTMKKLLSISRVLDTHTPPPPTHAMNTGLDNNNNNNNKRIMLETYREEQISMIMPTKLLSFL